MSAEAPVGILMKTTVNVATERLPGGFLELDLVKGAGVLLLLELLQFASESALEHLMLHP